MVSRLHTPRLEASLSYVHRELPSIAGNYVPVFTLRRVSHGSGGRLEIFEPVAHCSQLKACKDWGPIGEKLLDFLCKDVLDDSSWQTNTLPAHAHQLYNSAQFVAATFCKATLIVTMGLSAPYSNRATVHR